VSRQVKTSRITMKIRPAFPHDMVAIAELSRELAAHVKDPDPGSDASELSDCSFGPDRWFECFVAESTNRVVGFAAFCRRFEAHTREKRVWVSDLWVAANQRREGIGRALIAAVQARAAELGCAAVDFDVARGNDTARAFYKHLEAVICKDIEPRRLPTRAA
jgi:ribosomal protein S18 acetylase RimI-like enzyme